MALDIASILNTGGLAVQVQSITKDAGASAAAAGYGAFVSSIVGSAPAVKDLGNNRAKLVLSPAQNAAMQKWLDSQVRGMVSVGQEPPVVDLSMGDYLTPWSLKYMLPALIGAFLAGWLTNWMMSGRR